ncbi:MAG: hypothetical protein HKN59_06550 [Gammaproteobacteria bacterium]|nr:hypothetical protein [Gammaproteobacteria bacterium]
MIFDASSAALAIAIVLVLWVFPLTVFLLTTRLRGPERLSWALLLALLSWPAFALYLLCEGIRKPKA